MTKHLAKEARKTAVLEAALTAALRQDWQWMTREYVAEVAGVSVGCVNYHYGTMKQLKRAVMRAAVQRRILPLVAQGLVYKNEIALGAADDLKTEALNSLKA